MWTSGTATDYNDLFDALSDYLTLTGSAFGLEYSGTGTGTLTAYSGGASSVAETFTITATSSTSFTVVGSITGSIGPATVGTPFSHATIAFTLTAGGTAFVSGDAFTLTTAPKWTAKRKARGCTILADAGNTGLRAAQNLVDGKTALDDTRTFRATGPTYPFDIEFEFADAEMIASYELAAFTATSPVYMPEAWTLDYWTGSAWSTLDTVTGETGWGDTEVRAFTVGTPVSANKYRLHITTGHASYLGIGAVRLRRTDGTDAAFACGIFEAPGNDGDSEILVGVHLFERQDADYFDWEICGFDSYSATSPFYSQAGYHGKLFLPLWDASIPYWFIVDGRRAVVVAKLNTQYEVAYLGLLDSFFTPEQWPYPLALGGSLALGDTLPTWESTDFRWSNSDPEHCALTHADSGSSVEGVPEDFQTRARDWSGDWLGFRGRDNGGAVYVTSERHILWPVCGSLTLLDVNLDGTYTTWPVMLNTSTPNTVGEFRGVRVVTGQDLTAETMIDDGDYEYEWMALHNIFRTDRDDFFAVALD